MTFGTATCAVRPLAPELIPPNALAWIKKTDSRIVDIRAVIDALSDRGHFKAEDHIAWADTQNRYYVYYLAANMLLAKGDIDGFNSFTGAADHELSTIEDLIKEKLEELSSKTNTPL